MDWGSLITTVLPTIGNIVGGLLGANKIEDGVIYYEHKGVLGAQQGFSSQFYCEDGNYYLFNQSTSENDIVSMTFPARGQVGAETVMVPGRQSFDITPMFEENALQDSTHFELTACTAGQVRESMGAQQQGIKISSAGQGVQVGGQKQSIGSYLDVQVQQNQVTIYPKNGFQLQNLPMVQVQGSGDTGMRVIDISGQDPQAITVQLPQPLLPEDQVTVEVVANVQKQQRSVQEMVLEQKYAHLLRKVDDHTVRRIQDAPRRNWR